jgi:gluconolactonase
MKYNFLTLLIIFTGLFSCKMAQQTKTSGRNPVFVKVADSLKFPEGPAWDGKSTVYASNCYGDWITRISEGIADTFLLAPTKPAAFQKTNGLTFGPDGKLYACDYGMGAILRFSMTGECEIYASGFNGQKFNRPNDLAFDPAGNLYFTDPKSYNPNIRDGAIYRIDKKTSTVHQVFNGLAFPNGIAFSHDAKSVFICESARQLILKFKVSTDGSFTDSTEFVRLPGGDPDGIAFDAQENLYVAHFGAGEIVIVKPNGSIQSKISTPGKKPSNVEFAGKDLKTLFITECETNCIYTIKTEIPGFKLFPLVK